MIVRIMFAAATAAMLSGTALVDPPIGSRLGDRLRPSADQMKNDEAIKRGHELATCLVNKRAGPARRLLAELSDAGYVKAYKSLWAGEVRCYTGFDDNELVEGRTFDVPRDLMRGMLAERLISGDARTFAALAPLPRQRIYSRSWYAATGRHVTVDEMATCISETDPAATLALLRTPPMSPEEKAAFAALGQQFGLCLRIGTRLTANRQSMRAALADALYQRTIHPVAPAPAP